MSTSLAAAEATRCCDARHMASRLRRPEHGRFASNRNSSANLAGAAVPLSPPTNSTPVMTEFAPPTVADFNDGTTGGTSHAPGGHIRVAVRVRPLPPGEMGIIEVAGEGTIAIRKEAATGGNQFLATQQGRIEERQFDRVFGPSARQEEVYAWTCEPLVQTAMTEGRNMTVFVYGATGAGKTHTMFGAEEEDEQGIIFRTMREVFAQIQAQKDASEEWRDACEAEEDRERLEVRVSFLELYNEVVRDLLQDGTGATACRVLEDERRGVVQVSNLVEVPVRSVEEASTLLRAGMEARTVEATAANTQSSRAHAVFSLSVERVGRRPTRNGLFKSHSSEARVLHSKISLIDLAGSERAKDTQNSGNALKDGARINQSLLALANCIDALTAKSKSDQRAVAPSQKKKPPYRDSKLTLMLKGSLTGDGLVAMVANVHPGRSHFEDSNNTLEYAIRATTVKGRDQRRGGASRQSLVGIRPSGIPPLNAAQAARRRVSMPAFPTSARVADEEEARCTASSSTLPPPRFSARRGKHAPAGALSARTKGLDPKRTAFTWATASQGELEAAQTGDSAESSVSSPGITSPQVTLDQELLCAEGAPLNSSPPEPEECLSILSLPSDAVGEDEEYTSDEEEAGLCMESCLDEVLVCDEGISQECVAAATPTKTKESGTGGTPSRKSKAKESAAVLSSPSVKDSTAIPAFAAKIIAQLQAEKVELDAYVNALLRDNGELQAANTRLREANLEKDKQLASMMVAAVTPTA